MTIKGQEIADGIQTITQENVPRRNCNTGEIFYDVTITRREYIGNIPKDDIQNWTFTDKYPLYKGRLVTLFGQYDTIKKGWLK